MQSRMSYNRLGHIKVGRVVKGMPEQFNKIVLTTRAKNGGENFIPYEGFEGGKDFIKVRLAYPTDINRSFDRSPTSFLLINGLRYYAKVVNFHDKDTNGIVSQVFAFPLQENPNGVAIPLPTIFLGSYNEESKAKYGLETKSVLSVFVMNDDESDFLNNRLGIFTLKTSSANSYYEIENTLSSVASSIDPNVLRFCSFRMEMETKQSATSETGEVTYVRLLPPSQEDILRAYQIFADEQKRGLREYLQALEINIINSMQATIYSAITLDMASQFFGKERLEIEVQGDQESDTVSAPRELKEQLKKNIKNGSKATKPSQDPNLMSKIVPENKGQENKDLNAQVEMLSAKYPAITVTIIKTLITNYGIDSATEILATCPTLPSVIAAIQKKEQSLKP